VNLSGKTLVIAISDPSSFASDPVAQDVVHAEELAFKQLHGEVTRYTVRYVVLHSSPASYDARTAVIYPSSSDPDVIAYLGEIAPGVSDQTVGITNALDLLEVSPTDTSLELTQRTPAVSGAPHSYYESWSTYGQTFARVVPSGIKEANAQVLEMKALGVKDLYVSDDGSDYGRALADVVSTGAASAGIKITGSSTGAGADFYGAESPSAAASFFNHVAAADPTAKLFGTSSLDSASFTKALSASVHNLYVSIPGFMPKALTSAGRKFVADFKAAYGHSPNVEAIFGYEAMAAVLRVIQRERGEANDRTAVTKGFLSQRGVTGVVGTYSIDSAGNSNLDAFVFARPDSGKLVPFQAAPTS
jgi:ABC-type branched-subunit amino acid transport system substrate-binding protein